MSVKSQRLALRCRNMWDELNFHDHLISTNKELRAFVLGTYRLVFFSYREIVTAGH